MSCLAFLFLLVGYKSNSLTPRLAFVFNRIQRLSDCFDVDGRHPEHKFINNGGPELFARRHYIRKGARPPEERHTPEECKGGDCDYSDEPLKWGQVPAYARKAGKWSWSDALSKSTSYDAFCDEIRTHATRDFVLHHKSILDFAAEYFNAADPYVNLFEPDSFRPTGAMDDWVADVFSEVLS